MTLLDEFRMLYEQVSELVADASRRNEDLAKRCDSVQEDLTICKGMLVDLQGEIAAQVTAAEAETARLQGALSRVEKMLDRVSTRLATAVPSLAMPAGGVAFGEELPVDG